MVDEKALTAKDGKIIVSRWDTRCSRCGDIVKAMPNIDTGIIYISPCGCLSCLSICKNYQPAGRRLRREQG